ncbi:2TM domain-containing protein [Aureisphaera sp. CAU 1614]|uniref:2TM domain-containing protein n=2 Tax=Halomarinibacterium sedimenti TaxID=2857106 RepID=A0A9X1JXK4_9FLAO|nr:2TM domain-containing protein [Halomarinibacterium sedimenti]
MKPFNEDKYERAQKKVKEIKGFYTHLTVYILINTFLILAHMGAFSGNFMTGLPAWGYFTTPFFWGIGLAFHALYVFKDKFGMLKDWEERKIKEFMEKEEKEFKNNFDKDF